ncbi:MAG: lipoyl synthase [bacterium]
MKPEDGRKELLRKPPWLKRTVPAGATYQEVRRLIEAGGLHTVCREAHCPNLGECFSRGTATFLILGDRCTRNCRFCAIAHGPSGPPQADEPERVAGAVEEMQLDYVVVTSVTRDDLADGGAGIFARTAREIRKRRPGTLVELLVPDFQGSAGALETVLESGPDVLNHNVETVPRLYASVRPAAVYRRSLELLGRAKERDRTIVTKSGLMLGLGETAEEVLVTFRDLVDAGCEILTIGQYLQPSGEHLPVRRFIEPEEFERLCAAALRMGFAAAAGGPFVRSSYRARELYESARSRLSAAARE